MIGFYYSRIGKLARGTCRTASFLRYDQESAPDRRSPPIVVPTLPWSRTQPKSLSPNSTRPGPGPVPYSWGRRIPLDLTFGGLPTPPPNYDRANPFLRDRAPRTACPRRNSHKGTHDPHYASKLRGGKVGGTPARKSARDFVRLC
jgi:hypothetical protein